MAHSYSNGNYLGYHPVSYYANRPKKKIKRLHLYLGIGILSLIMSLLVLVSFNQSEASNLAGYAIESEENLEDSLGISGQIKLSPLDPGSVQNCTKEIAGSIYFSSSDKRFHGCNGTAWLSLND